MAKVNDPLAPFKGKQRLTEREANLLIRRPNDRKISSRQLRNGGYALTPSHIEKGRKYLMNLWLTPKGVERKNSPFGHREEEILSDFKSIRPYDVVDVSPARFGRVFLPVYEAIGGGDSFTYYISGEKINITG